jgi:hypothetical protein
MTRVDSSYYSLVAAAAQAAGPCPPDGETDWAARILRLTVDLHLIASDASQHIAELEEAHRFLAILEGVDIEESSQRGVVTLRPPSKPAEKIRTEQRHTRRGRELSERARPLQGHWVLVYRRNEKTSANGNREVRMLLHLEDLGDAAATAGD